MTKIITTVYCLADKNGNIPFLHNGSVAIFESAQAASREYSTLSRANQEKYNVYPCKPSVDILG